MDNIEDISLYKNKLEYTTLNILDNFINLIKNHINTIHKKDYKNLMNITMKAHKLIGCRGVSRSDFKFFYKKFLGG